MKPFQAARLYDKGWSLERIGKKFGITKQSVHHALKKLGHPRRPMSEARKEGGLHQRLEAIRPNDIAQAVRLVRRGEPIENALRQFRMSERPLRRVLLQTGFVPKSERACGDGVYRRSNGHLKTCDTCRLAWNAYYRAYRKKKTADRKKAEARERILRRRREVLTQAAFGEEAS